jgi:hypothetical protein
MERCHEIAEFLLPALSEVARGYGWALTTHGSMERDIDIVLIPWREGRPIAAETLVQQIFEVCKAVLGYVCWSGCKDGDPMPPATQKPHGRMAWSILFGGPYLDISVMPLPPEAG